MSRKASSFEQEDKQLQRSLARLVSELPTEDYSDSKRQARFRNALELPIEDLRAILQGAQVQEESPRSSDEDNPQQVERYRRLLTQSSNQTHQPSTSRRSMSSGPTNGSSSSSSSSGGATEEELAAKREEDKQRAELVKELGKHVKADELESYSDPNYSFKKLIKLYELHVEKEFVPSSLPPVEQEVVVTEEQDKSKLPGIDLTGEETIAVSDTKAGEPKSGTESSDPKPGSEQEQPPRRPIPITTGQAKAAAASAASSHERSPPEGQPAAKKIKQGDASGSIEEKDRSYRERNYKPVQSGDNNKVDDDDNEVELEEDDDDDDEDDDEEEEPLVVSRPPKSSNTKSGQGLAAGGNKATPAKSGNKKGGTKNSATEFLGDDTDPILTLDLFQEMFNKMDSLARECIFKPVSKVKTITATRGVCELCIKAGVTTREARCTSVCFGCSNKLRKRICWICPDHAMEHAYMQSKLVFYKQLEVEMSKF